MGKKTITVTTADFDSQSKPNHLTNIGAVPIMGRAAIKFPIGSNPRSKNLNRSTKRATPKAAEQPKIYPLKAPLTKVCTKSTQRIETLLINFINTKDGAGRITGLISKALIEASQISSKDTPNKIGGKTILVLARVDCPIRTFIIQAAIQKMIENKKKLFIEKSSFFLKQRPELY
jgi:hypothetical protein